MRSPLELLEGGYEHALLTTYSFNLRFFEEAVLRALWAAEVRNVVVFVDRDAARRRAWRPRSVGRGPRLPPRRRARRRDAFHPKLILLTGRDGARLCVSSANLTADGLMRNAESADRLRLAPRGHTAPILQAGELFRRLSEPGPAHTRRRDPGCPEPLARSGRRTLAVHPAAQPRPSADRRLSDRGRD